MDSNTKIQEISNPCDICLEEKCKGRHDCHCATCPLISECNKHLHATIRITNRCTQECSHCCFISSPKSNIMMSVEQSEKIAKFLGANGVYSLNLMGGEFLCNPDWFEILSNLIKPVIKARIVTNGDWAKSETVKTKLAELISLYKGKIKFSVSKDRWHTNKNVDEAAEFLKSTGVEFNVATPEETTGGSIVPVGRRLLMYDGTYSMFSCYCHSPKEKYSFLIDEEGNIYKCGFGIFRYAAVEAYLDGGFRKRFKEYNTFFYSKFIPNCKTCAFYATTHKNQDGESVVVKTE